MLIPDQMGIDGGIYMNGYLSYNTYSGILLH